MLYKEVFYTDSHGFDYEVSWWGINRKEQKIRCRFRFDPVPCTGTHWYHGNYYRHMKTYQERRSNYAYEGYTRGKRRNLPEPWDDWGRSDYKHNSWKKCTKRKRQYK